MALITNNISGSTETKDSRGRAVVAITGSTVFTPDDHEFLPTLG